jgi:uncharacterized protein
MTRIEPPVTDLSAPFWESTKDRSLTAQHCRDCQRWVWYPRSFCPGCLGSAGLEWAEVGGIGRIYACNVMRKPGNPMMGDDVPYVIALVDLDEGYRMSTNIVGVPPEDVACGQRVVVDWSHELSDGRRLPMFTPAERVESE